MSVEIELGGIAKFSCPCCGRESETVHGFLYDPRGETTVYFAGYTRGHPQRRANMVLSLGGWGEGKNPEDRAAVALEATFGASGGRDDVELTFPPAATSPWHGKTFLGGMREPGEPYDDDRARCRKLALIAVAEDPRIADYRANGSS